MVSSVVTSLNFFRAWKVAVLEYGFGKDFIGKNKDLIHITTELVESSLFCSREEWLLISIPNPGKTLLY